MVLRGLIPLGVMYESHNGGDPNSSVTNKDQGLGLSETALGKKNLAAEFTIVTKAATGVIEGSGKRQNILNSAQESLDALNIKKVGNRST
jgi:hypothetical protein